jgi:hypothetical protein
LLEANLLHSLAPDASKEREVAIKYFKAKGYEGQMNKIGDLARYLFLNPKDVGTDFTFQNIFDLCLKRNEIEDAVSGLQSDLIPIIKQIRAELIIDLRDI